MLRLCSLACLFGWGLLFVLGGTARAAEETGLKLQVDPSYVCITRDDRPLLKYRYGDGPPKPYVLELHSPAGVQILRDSPVDHVHHRGLMYGIFVNGIDFWSEQPNHGKQVSLERQGSVRELAGGAAVCRLEEKLQWVTQEAKPLLTENRSLTVMAAAADLPLTLVTWSLKLAPAEGIDKAVLTGSHYDGLGVRFVVSMDQVGRFLYSSGEPGPVVRGTERVTPCKWCAYVAPVDGRTVTVALFDHPDNPRQPAGMFTMLEPFSYLSATPNIWNNPLELAAGSSLQLQYGIALWDGETAPDAIEAIYGRWLKLLKD